MKIKKNIYHVIFFDIFFEIIIIILFAFCFFLGFELTKNNIIIYLAINGSIILLGVIVYILYLLICKTNYEFTDASIKIIKNGNILKEVSYSMIKYCKYYSFITLLLGGSKGGNLIIYYLEDNKEKNMEISCLKKLTKKLRLKIFYK